ncbi:MAG: hypothetical protein R3Y56_01320 [Akkermansia sp.]
MPDNTSPDSPKIAHKGLSTPSLICATVTFIVLLIMAVLAFSCFRLNIETRDGRMAGTSFPKELEQFTIESVDGCWESTEGNQRLALRAAYVPKVRVTISDVKTEGAIYCRFIDGQQKELGVMMPLYFNAEGFVESDNPLVKIDGFTATMAFDQGFPGKDYYYVHTIDELQPLWRVALSYKLQGENDRPDLGFISIPASDELPDKD